MTKKLFEERGQSADTEDPSMDDILASIRRILNEGGAPPDLEPYSHFENSVGRKLDVVVRQKMPPRVPLVTSVGNAIARVCLFECAIYTLALLLLFLSQSGIWPWLLIDDPGMKYFELVLFAITLFSFMDWLYLISSVASGTFGTNVGDVKAIVAAILDQSSDEMPGGGDGSVYPEQKRSVGSRLATGLLPGEQAI